MMCHPGTVLYVISSHLMLNSKHVRMYVVRVIFELISCFYGVFPVLYFIFVSLRIGCVCVTTVRTIILIG